MSMRKAQLTQKTLITEVSNSVQTTMEKLTPED